MNRERNHSISYRLADLKLNELKEIGPGGGSRSPCASVVVRFIFQFCWSRSARPWGPIAKMSHMQSWVYDTGMMLKDGARVA